MTRSSRRTLFYALLGLFLVAGATIVLYAQGWRLDLRTLRPEKVGGIFIRSFPQDASIFLNGKSVENKAGILSHGTLISDLFPKTYAVSLKKDGYADWHENTGVLPALVTELKYAVLVPNVPVAVSGKTILETPGGAILWNGKKIARGTIVSKSADSQSVIVKNTVTGAYSLYDLSAATSTDIAVPGGITSIAIDPYDSTKIIYGNKQKIWIWDAAQATSSVIERAPARDTLGSWVAASASSIAWTRFAGTSETSRVVLYDKFSGDITKSSSTIPGRTVALKWIGNGALGILTDGGSLYRYDASADQFKKLADDVKNFEVAGDGSLLAAVENKSLEIFSFTDASTYRRFNLPDMANVTGVRWYKDMNHLFVNYADHISFLELGDLGLNNFTTIAEGSSPFYDASANALYLVSAGSKLIRFDFPN